MEPHPNWCEESWSCRGEQRGEHPIGHRSLVQQELVPREKLLEGGAIAIQCVHGDTVSILQHRWRWLLEDSP